MRLAANSGRPGIRAKRNDRVGLDSAETLAEVPATRRIIAALLDISREAVPDMPDRVIAATALSLGVPLISRDRKIRESQIQTIW